MSYPIDAGIWISALSEFPFVAGLSPLFMEDDDQTALMGGLVWRFTQSHRLGVKVSIEHDTLTTGFGTRFYFH